MTPRDRDTLLLMLSRALRYEATLMGTQDGKEGAALDRQCERNMVRFKTCADRLVMDSARLVEARKLIAAYLETMGTKPRKDIIQVDDRARAWLAADK
jgi:hypothetical protein